MKYDNQPQAVTLQVLLKRLKDISYLLIPIVLVVVVLDQWTKGIVEDTLIVGEVIPVIDGVFNLTHAKNKGAAFGMFAGLPDGIRQLVLWSVSGVALAAVFYFLLWEYYSSRVGQIALSAILGGAVGNGIDRAVRGEVVDFLDFYYGTYHWPAFNVADSAITTGATVLIILALFIPAQSKIEESPQSG